MQMTIILQLEGSLKLKTIQTEGVASAAKFMTILSNLRSLSEKFPDCRPVKLQRLNWEVTGKNFASGEEFEKVSSWDFQSGDFLVWKYFH